MNRAGAPLRPLVVALLMTILAACTTLRTAQQPAAPEAAPVQAADAAPAPEPSTSSEQPHDIQPSGADALLPPCLPVAKVKPKPKPRPKPVRKQAPPQPQTAPVVAEAPSNAVIDAQVVPINVSVMSILGKKVRGPKDEDLGRVVDVLADATGRVRVAIVDFGGFLGVGNHRIAVDWPLLRFNPDSQEPSLLLNVSREKLQSAPEYKESLRPQMLVVPAPPAAAAPESKQ